MHWEVQTDTRSLVELSLRDQDFPYPGSAIAFLVSTEALLLAVAMSNIGGYPNAQF
jgi:hypothetical protein